MTVVEIWQIDLTAPVAGAVALLSADERARAARMAAPERWIAARAALRVVLAQRLDTTPQAVTITTTAHGKPELPGPGARLRFNHSHSGDRALIALAEAVEVGVDVERTSRRSNAVERALTPGEAATLHAAGDRHLALLQTWCRKEALAKARGDGLGWAPQDVDTTTADDHVLLDLRLDAGYVGALAVAAARARVSYRRL
ncbi:MAG TPA: 4'-phosphopantetheinyl transferase superfamily protein [Solirubrobacter sp.]|nr:4'-phosphopantetheinyl transferase superfamily protein [Solirubrobacter sp.]